MKLTMSVFLCIYFFYYVIIILVKYMKKIFFFIILFSLLPVKALTNNQASDLTFFTTKFIENGNKKINQNSIFKYDFENRITGYHNQLNQEYWCFDNSSFISFIYYQTLGLTLTKKRTNEIDSYSGLIKLDYNAEPYQLDDFKKDKYRFTYIVKNKNIDLSLLKKADLIIIDTNIMLYLGDNKVAYFSQEGAVIEEITSQKGDVIRLKDTVIDPDKEVNLKVNWGLETEDFNILKTSNDKPVIIVKKSDDWVTKMNLTFNITDHDGIYSYTFNDEEILLSGKVSSITKEITENGTYTISVKDVLGNISKEEVTITTIDTNPPVIEDITVTPSKGYATITIKAKDLESGLDSSPYSINSKDWFAKTSYDVNYEGDVKVYVKDKAGNISVKTVSVKINDPIEPKIENIIIGQEEENGTKVIISFNVAGTKQLAIFKSESDLEWIKVEGEYITYLKPGIYSVWLKDNNMNVVDKKTITIKSSNNLYLLWIVPIILIGASCFLFVSYKNNKI